MNSSSWSSSACMLHSTTTDASAGVERWHWFEDACTHLDFSIHHSADRSVKSQLVLDRLDEEAERLFVPRGQVRSINETLRRLDELRREQRERTTRPREWAELAAAVEAARCRDEWVCSET